LPADEIRASQFSASEFMDTNPFTVLTFIAAPAILTNASSVLALGTSNRFARAVDRARELSKTLEKDDLDLEIGSLWQEMLGRAEIRGQFLIRALRSFYTALGSFAGASLVSLLGAVIATTGIDWLVRITLSIAFLFGTIGFCGLVYGCWLLIHETNLALQNLQQESELIRARRARRG
jgi:Protein of unknown function (DUF2721)